MPNIEISTQVALPASLLGPQILTLLKAIANSDPPFADFAISLDFGALHLPHTGMISIPISVSIQRAPPSALRIDFSFHAKDGQALFPTFQGSLRTDPEGVSASRVWLVGEYTPPLGFTGRVLDRTILNSSAITSLGAFLDTLVLRARTDVEVHELEVIRAGRLNC